MDQNYAKNYSKRCLMKREIFKPIIAGSNKCKPGYIGYKQCYQNSRTFFENTLRFNESIRPQKRKDKTDIFNYHELIL
jgi:hypothetical protein